MPVDYQLPLTLISIIIAIAASGLALFVVSRGLVGTVPLLVAGPIMGVGIASMHYVGMAAMHMQATVSYDAVLVALSVLIAVVASIAALYLSFRLNRRETSRTRWLKGGAALVMGAAIVGMHYTGMAAAIFTPTSTEAAPSYDLNTPILGFGIGLFTLVILGLALIGAIVDRRFSAQAVELDESMKALLESEKRFRGLSDATFEGVAITELLHPQQRLHERLSPQAY
jgi:NO-binding membrane sensor protein with MHYT domain